jgi:hypothetical protein
VALSRWCEHAFTFQHWSALRVEIWCDLYEGRPESASRRLTAAWPALDGSKMLRVRLFASDAWFLRGTVALACAAAGKNPARSLRAAARDAKALARLRRSESAALGELLSAGVAAAQGDEASAIARLDAAIAGLRGAGLALHAACALRRKGELVGGGEGRALMAEGDELMRAEGITDPARWCAMYAPAGGGRR